MNLLSMSTIENLKSKIADVETGLAIHLTKARTKTLEVEVYTIAKYIDNILENNSTTETLNIVFDKGVKKQTLTKATKELKNQVKIILLQYLQEAPSSISEFNLCFEERGYKPCAIEKLEGKKLALNLVEQQGYYLLQKDKQKVLIQSSILLGAAKLIEDLSKATTVVSQVLFRLDSLSPYKAIFEVTDFEEQVISECYSFLLKILDDLNIVI